MPNGLTDSLPGMSEPEVRRQIRQQRGDIDALSLLVQGVDRKVDALDAKLDQRAEALDTELDGRVDALDTKLDTLAPSVDRRFDDVGAQLTEILRRLDRR